MISGLVNSLKGLSSRLLRPEFPDLHHHYSRAKRL
jgi:REP element-mobilizing transposase RayT